MLKDLTYSLNYLEINNVAIDQSYRRYFGYEFTYAGYLSKLRDYYKNAFEFSDNLIYGLKGKDGISAVKDLKERQLLQKRFDKIFSALFSCKKPVMSL